MKNKRDVYLFDFDGTLTKVDTLFDFLKHSFPDRYKRLYFKYFISFILVKLKFKNPATVKQRFIASFLKRKTKAEIGKLAQNYFENRKDYILRESAIDFINQIDDIDDIYLVSASLDIWLQPFAKFFKAQLICTEAEFTEQGIFTGNFSNQNCNFEEKKKRIAKEINLNDYNQIFAFGDSKGDLEMFSLATKSYHKHFK